jgi:sialate O-acetylesterase
MKRTFFIGMLLIAGLASQLRAEIKLPAIFADHMILQRETSTSIWGKADPQKRVTVVTSWNLKRYTTTSAADGSWKLTITTPKAGGPHTIVISDGKPMTLTNVMSGEVWLCSGQSNMEMPVKGFTSQPVEGSEMDILRSGNSKIRVFTVKRNHSLTPLDNVTGHWQEAMPISVRDFSATGYYFGRLLNEILDIPVGLINSSWGGSRIEAWMDQEMLASFPGTKMPTETENIQQPNQKPLYLYQAMIHPLLGFAVRGVIWYQGESNRNNAHEYTAMFSEMVKGWRSKWNQPDMPFYFCQIAPFEYKDGKNSAYLREAQLKAALEVKNTGMAVLMDAGEQLNIHPAKKREAGERMALLALSNTYAMPGINGESPVYKSMKIRNDTITVQFDNAPVGVAAKDFESKLFMVAGDDKVFYPAKTRVRGSTVIVTSEQVKEPKAVRYAFDNYLVGDLFGTNGLPVSSFRSDNW